jgi:uncharacterized protein GlcG (DUF336 family)
MKTIKILIGLFILTFTTTLFANTLSTEEATKLAQEAIKVATKQKYVVAATVVDKTGLILATVRTENAKEHTPKTSFKKAYTALFAKENTTDLINKITNNGKDFFSTFVVSTLADGKQDNIVFLGGGMLIKKNGEIIGAIGVGGAPGGHLDDAIIVEALKNLKMGS